MDPIPTLAPAQAAEFESRLDRVLSDLSNLPTLPQILWEVLAQLQDSQNAAADLASAIEDDPSLTANILRRGNSAFYGFSERFVSVRDAVVAIGRNEIERMVCATLVIEAFDVADDPGSMNYEAFWTHSIEVAEVSEFISTLYFWESPYAPMEGYLAGLLHDIGKLLLNQTMPNDWMSARVFADAYGCSDAEAERATLGMDHGEVGARLMEAWGLHPNFIEGNRWHHRLSGESSRRPAHAEIVGFADRLCHLYEKEALSEKGVHHTLFPLDESQVAKVVRLIVTARKRAATLLA